METDGARWGNGLIEFEAPQTSTSWARRPVTPILCEDDKPSPTQPDVDPPWWTLARTQFCFAAQIPFEVGLGRIMLRIR